MKYYTLERRYHGEWYYWGKFSENQIDRLVRAAFEFGRDSDVEDVRVEKDQKDNV